MDNAIITVILQGEGQKQFDLEISVSITVGKCMELLENAHWLPDSSRYHYEISADGDKWTQVDEQAVLSQFIHGDGSLIRISQSV